MPNKLNQQKFKSSNDHDSNYHRSISLLAVAVQLLFCLCSFFVQGPCAIRTTTGLAQNGYTLKCQITLAQQERLATARQCIGNAPPGMGSIVPHPSAEIGRRCAGGMLTIANGSKHDFIKGIISFCDCLICVPG